MTSRVYEAVIDESGNVRLCDTVVCARKSRALVIVLEGEKPSDEVALSDSQNRSTSNAVVNEASRESSEAAILTWRHRYTLVAELGQGGMGRAMLAERLSDRGQVCLKFLHEGTNARVLEQECRALLRLRHPTIVSLIDFSSVDKPPWLAMEFVAGIGLKRYMTERAALPMNTVIKIVREVLQGLEYAHSQQIIHRDLKPTNLILQLEQRDFRVRILDFGLAIVDSQDHEGNFTAFGATVAGTLAYMAPEQLESKLLTAACDIYSLGVIAWEMLAGRPAFSNEPGRIVVEKFNPCHLGELPHGIPSPIARFVQSCTKMDPTLRPSASEALASLAKITT
ncbi:MAG TPA: serine/threonine-protein kinase [Dongiaceae bacterium]|nr:serine/threonine-protein kinase [Dongiaceae bacterium]